MYIHKRKALSVIAGLVHKIDYNQQKFVTLVT